MHRPRAARCALWRKPPGSEAGDRAKQRPSKALSLFWGHHPLQDVFLTFPRPPLIPWGQVLLLSLPSSLWSSEGKAICRRTCCDSSLEPRLQESKAWLYLTSSQGPGTRVARSNLGGHLISFLGGTVSTTLAPGSALSDWAHLPHPTGPLGTGTEDGGLGQTGKQGSELKVSST